MEEVDPCPPLAGTGSCEACSECVNFEFQTRNVATTYRNKSHFINSQWKIPLSAYMTYRIIVASLVVSWIIADFIVEARQFYSDHYYLWLIFATNWSFILLGMCAVTHAVLVIIYYVKSKCNQKTTESDVYENNLNVPCMIFWMLHSCAFNLALIVTTAYWSFQVTMNHSEFLVTPMSQLKHTLNTVYVVIDLMISAMPIRILHLVYPLTVGVIYVVFNALYFSNNGLGPEGHDYAYAVMNWQTHPLGSAFVCAMSVMMTIIMQVMLYGIYRLRLFIHGRLVHTRYDVIELERGELLPCQQEQGEVQNGPNTTSMHHAVSYKSTDTADGTTVSGPTQPDIQ